MCETTLTGRAPTCPRAQRVACFPVIGVDHTQSRGSHLRLQSEHVEILSRASTSKFFQWAGYMYSISESSGAVCAPAREM
jgi:hypothetical protein